MMRQVTGAGDFSARAGRFLAAVLVLAATLFAIPAMAQTLDTVARQAIVLDYETGAVIFEKNADQQVGPASMTKLMTAYLVFERLQQGALSLDDTFVVSEKAWRMGGSKMFVEVGDRVRLEDLLLGIIVQSGNDATIVVAEGIAGSEAAFAELMTEKAHELGMTDTRFANASGWPDPNLYSTVRDIATLSSAIIRQFPEYYHYYSVLEFTYAGIRQPNRNPLLYRNIGADGLKTGHTEASGYGLAFSAERDGRRLVGVVHGLPSMATRGEESEKILDWAFREWDSIALYSAGQVVDQAPVWLGSVPSVPVVSARDVKVSLLRRDRADLSVSVRYPGPVPAPIAVGDPLGEIVIQVPNRPEITVPLVAAAPAAELGPLGRALAAFDYLLFGPGS